MPKLNRCNQKSRRKNAHKLHIVKKFFQIILMLKKFINLQKFIKTYRLGLV